MPGIRRTHWSGRDPEFITVDAARRILAYSRDSADRLRSVYGQDQEIEEWAELNGYEIVGYARDVKAHSLSPASERPALSAAIQAVEDGRADGIAVRSLDRLARDFLTQDDAIRRIWAAGGRFFSCEYGEWKPDHPGSPAWRLRRDYARMAEDQRLELIAKLQKGRREKMKLGGYGGGYRLERKYGMELVLVQGRWDYRPVPEEQAVIRRICKACVGGRGYEAMARTLNAEGIPTVTGAEWSKTMVRKLAKRGPQQLVAIPNNLAAPRPLEWIVEATG